ncbi:uncharacterized protein LOC133199107 [Saccostrea echinata]|uniref:uncharacterized protein LOC133199107 n=1 Tax=Saccostrea echinata TaxID=191078 RepID=UPI002A837791|nr:uncharacterized protein LOC133199107 [Saccostrea echinata]
MATIPAPCCLGQQFSASIDETGGQVPEGKSSRFIDEKLYVQFDYTNKRMYIEGSTKLPLGGRNQFKLVNDYKTNQMFSLTNGVCYAMGTPSTPLQDPCQLLNATFVGSSLLGSPSKHIAVNTFQMTLDETKVKVVLSADGSCTPVLWTIVGNLRGAQQQLTMTFSNYTPGLKDASVFSFDRSSCQPAPTSGP